MSQATFFISYRREDTAGYARSVCDALAREFGAERVFMDVDDIAVGQPFSEVIQQAMGGSQVLLVLIGPRWRGDRDGQPSRIMAEGDFVHLEVSTALRKGMRVIPLLFDGAVMPAPAQLPADIRALSERNALEVNATRFAADMARLVEALNATAQTPRGTAQGNAGGTARRPVILGAVAVAVALVAGAFWFRAPSPSAAAVSIPSATPSARAPINGEWQATVRYAWSNDDYVERFSFEGDVSEVNGSASFLRVPRALQDGRIETDGATFLTRTREMSGAEQVHRYRVKLIDGELHVRMQTEVDGVAQLPLEFVARRAALRAAP